MGNKRMKLTKEQKKNARKWVKALRSGDYDQGHHNLCTVFGEDVAYCCLGVAAEVVHGEDAWTYSNSELLRVGDFIDGPYENEGLTSLAHHTLEQLGIDTATEADLIRLNDVENYSFEEIADWLEKRLDL